LKAFRKWRLKRNIAKTKNLLTKINKAMKITKMPRWKRKQIWRDFIKSEKNRAGMFDFLDGTTDKRGRNK